MLLQIYCDNFKLPREENKKHNSPTWEVYLIGDVMRNANDQRVVKVPTVVPATDKLQFAIEMTKTEFDLIENIVISYPGKTADDKINPHYRSVVCLKSEFSRETNALNDPFTGILATKVAKIYPYKKMRLSAVASLSRKETSQQTSRELLNVLQARFDEEFEKMNQSTGVIQEAQPAATFTTLPVEAPTQPQQPVTIQDVAKPVIDILNKLSGEIQEEVKQDPAAPQVVQPVESLAGKISCTPPPGVCNGNFVMAHRISLSNRGSAVTSDSPTVLMTCFRKHVKRKGREVESYFVMKVYISTRLCKLANWEEDFNRIQFGINPETGEGFLRRTKGDNHTHGFKAKKRVGSVYCQFKLHQLLGIKSFNQPFTAAVTVAENGDLCFKLPQKMMVSA